jgi:recombination protein RecT
MSKNEVKNTEAAQAPSARFMNLVVKEFENNAGEVQLTDHMKRLVQSNFIKLDSVLKENETKRLKKSEQYRDALEFSWKNVNMEKMAQDCIAFAMVGLDPMQPNQLFLIPYKNGHTNKFDIGFMPGYKGIEIKARKFGLDIPKDVVIELIHVTDTFTVKKKDFNNPVEHYILDVANPFDRGEVIGGFYYFKFEDETKNHIRMFSINDILKRKPKYASPEFWGGEKDKWVDNKKKGKEKVEGWFEEMCFKTIYRAAYGSITIDSEKINDHFVNTLNIESEYISNAITVDADYQEVEEPKTEVKILAPTTGGFEFTGSETKEKEPVKKDDPKPEKKKQDKPALDFPETE